MTLNYNNNSVNDVKFNGDDVEILQFNGITVWERYTPPVVLFESSAPGNYSLTLTKPTACSVVVVGGGAAGTSYSFIQKYGGGSGACVYGTTTLPAGTYSISVGGGSVKPSGTSSATAGGYSSITQGNIFIISVEGGKSHEYNKAGKGGNTFNITDETGLTKVNGNDASSSSGGSSVYNGYGKGGNYDQNGDPGYIKIETI